MKNLSDLSITEVAAYVAHELDKAGLDVVVVGGLAVEIYTHNKYLTVDIDMIERGYETQRLNATMKNLGFSKKGKSFYHPNSDYFVEFPSAPLEVAGQIIEDVETIQTSFGSMQVIRVEDLIKDRLLAYWHWKDVPSLFQALCMMSEYAISIATYKGFALQEMNDAEYNFLGRCLDKVNSLDDLSLTAVEAVLLDDAFAKVK